MIASNS